MLAAICVSSETGHDVTQRHVIDLCSLPRQSNLPSQVSHQPGGQGEWRRPACVRLSLVVEKVCVKSERILHQFVHLSLYAHEQIAANEHHAHR